MADFREWRLDTRRIGKRVLAYDQTDSTNARCRYFAGDRTNDGLVILAREQTAGRGRHERRWLCQPEDGVLLSTLVFPPSEVCRPAVLTAWAALSVCSLVDKLTGLDTRIKWPNDVLLDGRKICGILIEQKCGVIAGIGLNLNQTEATFAGNDLAGAGSLRLFTGQMYDAKEMALRLIDQLDRYYCKLLSGDTDNLQAQWREKLDLIGKDVRIEYGAAVCAGKLLDATFSALTLETSNGNIRTMAPDSVQRMLLNTAKPKIRDSQC